MISKGMISRIFKNGYVFPIIGFLAIIYYQFTGLQVNIGHEGVYPLFYGKINLDSLTLINSDFSGREVAPIAWPLVGSVLLLFSKITIYTQSILAAIFAFFTLFVGIQYCKAFSFSRTTSTIFLTLIFTAFGDPYRLYMWVDQVWVWPMNSYGVYDIFALLCIIQIKNLYDRAGNAPIFCFKSYVTTALLLLIFSLNGIRGFVMIAGSILAPLVIYEIYNINGYNAVKSSWFKGIVCLISISSLGVIFSLMLGNGIPQPWQEPHKYATLSSFLEFKERILWIPYGWLELFDVIPKKGSVLFSPLNVAKYTGALFSIFILIYPAWRLLNGSVKNNFEKIISLRLFYIVVILLITNIFGSASGTHRYLIPIAYAAFFITPFYLEDWISRKKIGALILFVCLLLPSYIKSVVGLTHYSIGAYKETSLFQAAQYLKDQGLNYGYAGPWDSNVLVINLYSGSDVKVYPIDINPIKPHLHANKNWYKGLESISESFIMIPQDAPLTRESIEILDKSVAVMNFKSWRIYKFDGDIASQFSHKQTW